MVRSQDGKGSLRLSTWWYPRLKVRRQLFLANDYLGIYGFEHRLDMLQERLNALAGATEKRVQVALYFGGGPVVGNMGVQTEFRTKAIGSFRTSDPKFGMQGARRPTAIDGTDQG